MSTKISKVELEMLKQMKENYQKRWGAPLGRRLCIKCNKISKNEEFKENQKICRLCVNARHRAYVAVYKQAKIDAGCILRARGRPPLSESVKKKRAEDKEAEKMARKEARAKAKAKLKTPSRSSSTKKKKN